MTAILAFILTNKTLLGIGAAIVGFFGVYVKGRLAGAAKERAQQAAAETKARDIADSVDNDIGAMTPEQRREALKQWSKS